MPLRTAAFAVHVFTACGAACALLALVAAVRADWAQMFIWLGVALFIDGVDGTFARRLRVANVLPRWSGDVLDLVVDILNYVFVPAYALAASALLPPAAAVPLGIVIVVSGSLYFADRLMKTSDHYFRGFPALWNVAAFYLFLLHPAPWLAIIAILGLAALTFVPFHVLHPVRIARWRALTLAALVLWTGLAVFAVATDLQPGFWTVVGLCLLAIYFVGVGFLRRHHP
ncbi:MAG TPA: phosphatidylcholine synthase [Xanthobacteraceae bacterium]|nr:phosphatidylcholine synthase [Xanthobacteraceae bacterium]